MSAIGQPGLENVWNTIGAYLPPNEQTLLPETAKIIGGKKQGSIGVPNLTRVPVEPLNTIRTFLTTKENFHLSHTSQAIRNKQVGHETKTAIKLTKVVLSLSKNAPNAPVNESRMSAKAATILVVATTTLSGIVTAFSGIAKMELLDVLRPIITTGVFGHFLCKNIERNPLHAHDLERDLRKTTVVSLCCAAMISATHSLHPVVAAGIEGLALYNLYRTFKS